MNNDSDKSVSMCDVCDGHDGPAFMITGIIRGINPMHSNEL